MSMADFAALWDAGGSEAVMELSDVAVSDGSVTFTVRHPLALVAASAERVHDEGPLNSRGVDEDRVVVVVADLHGAQWSRPVSDLAGIAVQHRAVVGLKPRPQLVEGEMQRVDRGRRPRQGWQVREAPGDTSGEVLEARAALRVTGEDPDALPEALQTCYVKRVAVSVMDGLASRPLGDEHEPRAELAVGEGRLVL